MLTFLSKRGRHKNRYDDVDTPTVEIFGSALALLIVVFILTNFVSSQNIVAMIDRSVEGAKYKVVYQNGSEGFVVITYPNKLRIIQTNEEVKEADICQENSPFMQYIQEIYGQKKQLIFAMTDNSISTMAKARECLRTRFLDQNINIAWIIANKDLLSNVRLQDLPAHIKRSIAP